MKIDIITLFPDMFQGPFDESILRRAQNKSLVSITIHNLRDWALDERGTVDDRPYGGGIGMLLRPEPIFHAVEEISNRYSGFISESKNRKALKQVQGNGSKIVLLDAGGTPYTQKRAVEYSKLDHLILICGHYEGVDYRVHEHLADEVISTGDYVVTGGEIPAMIVADSVIRLLPGVLEKEDATEIESFSADHSSRVEFPQYTRPENFNSLKVPEILLSGNHAAIEKWRKKESEKRTTQNRPDLMSQE